MNTDGIIDAISYIDENIIAEHTTIRFSRMNTRSHWSRKNILRNASLVASICLLIGSAIYLVPMVERLDRDGASSVATGLQSTTKITSSIIPDKAGPGTHILTIDKELVVIDDILTKDEILNTLKQVRYNEAIKAIIANYVEDGYLNNEDMFIVDTMIYKVFVEGEENRLNQRYTFLPIVNANGDLVARIEFLKNKKDITINVSCGPSEVTLNQLLKEYPNQDIIMLGLTVSEVAITPDGKIHLVGGVMPEYDPEVFYYDYYNAGVNVFTSDMLKNDRLMCVYVKNQQEVNE